MGNHNQERRNKYFTALDARIIFVCFIQSQQKVPSPSEDCINNLELEAAHEPNWKMMVKCRTAALLASANILPTG